MAGVNMSNDEGVSVNDQSVPAIGGADYRRSIGLDPSIVVGDVVASAHLGSDFRAEGVAYNEVPGMDVTTEAYPAGTAMTDSTPGDPVN